MSRARYQVTVEFTPDLEADPDTYRLHSVRVYRFGAAGSTKAVREIERKLSTLQSTDAEKERYYHESRR